MSTKGIVNAVVVVGFCFVILSTLTSSSTGTSGVVGAANGSGCGGCHGMQNTATSISLSGIPGNGYVPGTTYNLTLTVSNSTRVAAGFDLIPQGGTLSNAPSGTNLIGTSELHHISPKSLTNSAASWNFSWTAPSNPNVSFRVAANAVNGNGGSGGDQWNMTTINYTQAPVSISEVDQRSANVYPNPATDELMITTNQHAALCHVQIISLLGSITNPPFNRISDNEYKLDVSSLAAGRYILILQDLDGKLSQTGFVKR